MAVTVYVYSRSFIRINLTKLVIAEVLHHGLGDRKKISYHGISMNEAF